MIIETEKWPGRWAGIAIANGHEVVVEGERKLLSLCRYSKDSQKLYNYARQEMGRKIGFAPKSMWLATVMAIPAKFREMWNTVHEETYGTLYWEENDGKGGKNTKPTLIETPSIDPQLSQEVAVTDNELKDTTGVPLAYVSGVAPCARMSTA